MKYRQAPQAGLYCLYITQALQIDLVRSHLIGERSMARLLVTSALPYANGKIHIGHVAGAYLPADIFVRFKRLVGDDVRFVCGSDDHGVAIMLTAEREGRTPAEVAKAYWKSQSEDFASIDIDFDVYGSTSQNSYHTETSQHFFRSLFDRGFFEKRRGLQFYDPSREVFLPDRFVRGTCGFCNTADQNGDQCENCGKILDAESLKNAVSVFSGEPAEVRETYNWYLDLSKFEGQVRAWTEKSTLRETTRRYLTGLLSTGLVQRSMTRDLSWGIPLPLDDPDAAGKVLYVWFDAPIGYISNTKELCAERDGSPERYAEWWQSEDCKIYHFIGEDNTVFHCIIWIAMLSAEGSCQLPSGVVVNQFVNIQFPGRPEEKISKSRGTAIWVGEYVAKGGDKDALRYYLAAIAPERARAVFKPEDMVARYNADLANTVGNFVHRVLSFSRKHFGERVPALDEESLDEDSRGFLEKREESHTKITAALEGFQSKAALEEIMSFARECNRYVDEKAPWKLRKEHPDEAARCLSVCMHAILSLGIWLTPFIPASTSRLLGFFEAADNCQHWELARTRSLAGTLFREPAILFQKIELPEFLSAPISGSAAQE